MELKKELKVKEVAAGIYQIETHYLNREKFACCYLLKNEGEAAVIETNTNNAVPYILAAIDKAGLDRKQVKYVIVTHIHLDHAGGSGELMRHLPEAKFVLHPRGKRHMINPEKLIESVKQVYGEEKYREYYGEIVPVKEECVLTVEDGETIKVGGRELLMLDTPGHAKHHIIIFDRKSGSLFSGDAFGIGYPRYHPEKPGLVFPSTSPTQFDPEGALETLRRIGALYPSRVLRTHFGAIENITGNIRELSDWIEFAVDISNKRYAEGLREEELAETLEHDIWAQYEMKLEKEVGSELTGDEREFLFIDASLNAKGLAYYITKLNS
jgi:glyoxylase-like metal-dependent hydrolase (beta-lactamase superfamily II)